MPEISPFIITFKPHELPDYVLKNLKTHTKETQPKRLGFFDEIVIKSDEVIITLNPQIIASLIARNIDITRHCIEQLKIECGKYHDVLSLYAESEDNYCEQKLENIGLSAYSKEEAKQVMLSLTEDEDYPLAMYVHNKFTTKDRVFYVAFSKGMKVKEQQLYKLVEVDNIGD